MMKRGGWAGGTVLAAVLGIAPFAAAAGPPVAAAACGEEGTWQGLADNGFSWMNTITRGGDATHGQLDLAWVTIDPTLGGAFATAVQTTPARGVWRKVDARSARWTWMTYGLDAAGAPAYSIRASGTHLLKDCDQLNVAYVLEVFVPSQDMDTDPPVARLQGTAVEKRMALRRASYGPPTR
jgi:hypothetical protein